MKHFILFVSASSLALSLFGQEKLPQLKDWRDTNSYSVGMTLGRMLGHKEDINPDIVAAGLKDAIAGKPQLTQDQANEVLAQFPKDKEQKQKELGEKNKTDGAKFLEENKKKPGVKTTASGQEKSAQLKDQKDKYSYSIGMNLGSTLKGKKGDINPDVVAAGLKDATALSEDQFKADMVQLRKDMEQKQKELGEKNKTDGAKFLEENKKKPGVKTTASGLQYKVEKEGTGVQPKLTDMATVIYHVSSTEGTEFDAYKAGKSVRHPVSGFMNMKGWTEALQLMKVGSKYQVFVPSNLAYGERSMGEIGPNATLIFDVELLDAKPAPTFPPQGAPLFPPAAPKASPSPK
jgi:FKBP-type peptidyl-prolyl cis-trans isomerase